MTMKGFMAKKRRLNKDKELEKKCIKKFILNEYKNIAQAGGAKMKALGLETALEACEALFKEGKLIMKAFDENSFCVILKHGTDKFELIYDSVKEL